MENEDILKKENISFTDDKLIVSGKKITLSEIESIVLTEANPARDRAFLFIAIGVILIIFTSRWFMAGGFLAVLAGIVTFFDSRRKYTIYAKTPNGEKPVAASYDYERIKQIKALVSEKTTS